MNDSASIFDFSSPESIKGWTAIDDRIMGGRSLSRPEFIEGGGLRFRGSVSFDNGGGFASLRSPEADYRLKACEGLTLRVCGDGKRYKIGVRTDRFFDGISYQAGFATEDGEWRDILLPFLDFVPTHHGRRLAMVPPLDPGRIQSFGLFIADRQAGPFHLDLAWIRVY